MNQVFYQNSLLKFVRTKKGRALDLASGNETFVKLLLKNNWYVDSVDLKKNNNFNKKNYTFHCIDLEKTKLPKIRKRLALRKYDLVILFRFLHRPLFRIIPFLMKKNMLREKELFNLKNCSLNLLKFYQGKDSQKGNIIQTAIFKKV